MTAPATDAATPVRLGLRENLAQFTLLVIVNAFVGAMVGLERSILPAMAEQEFQLAARTAVLSFIVVFGIAKALTNYGAGRLSERFGRKHVLVAGWLVAVPVPFLLMSAPTWNWVLAANLLLGISQGLTWSTTVIMKIDLVGPRQRGLAMGLNEFAGYVAVAASALATGWIAARYGIRPQPFYLGVAFVVVGLALSTFLVRETRHHVAHESTLVGALPPDGMPTPRQVFWRTTLLDSNLASVSQAGLVNNLNDGMAWGLFPLVFAAAGMNLAQVGVLAATGLLALKTMIERLAEDHANARRLAEGLRGIPGIELETPAPQTNMVYFRLAQSGKLDAAEIVEQMRKRGILADRADLGGRSVWTTAPEAHRAEEGRRVDHPPGHDAGGRGGQRGGPARQHQPGRSAGAHRV